MRHHMPNTLASRDRRGTPPARLVQQHVWYSTLSSAASVTVHPPHTDAITPREITRLGS